MRGLSPCGPEDVVVLVIKCAPGSEPPGAGFQAFNAIAYILLEL